MSEEQRIDQWLRRACLRAHEVPAFVRACLYCAAVTMLSKVWARAGGLLRGSLSRRMQRPPDDEMLRSMLVAQYEQLSLMLEAAEKSTGDTQLVHRDYKSHPFINERIIKEQKSNSALESIFSLQTLKQLGTKEGPELARLQLKLQKSLEEVFSPPTTSPSPPPISLSTASPPLSTPHSTTYDPQQHPQIQSQEPHPQPQASPPQVQGSPSQQPPSFQRDTPKLTAEEKKEIEQLTDDTSNPKSLGFMARMFSWIYRPSTRLGLGDADVSTLYQLIQDKTAELNALRLKRATSDTSNSSTNGNTTSNNNYNNDDNNINMIGNSIATTTNTIDATTKLNTPSSSISTTAEPVDTTTTTKSVDITATTTAKSNMPATSDATTSTCTSTSAITLPAHVIEQIKRRVEMKAAGVAPDKLPKIDLSGVSTATLKQIYQSYQYNKPSNKKPT